MLGPWGHWCSLLALSWTVTSSAQSCTQLKHSCAQYCTQPKVWPNFCTRRALPLEGQPFGDQFTQGGAEGMLALCFLQYFTDVAFAFAACEMSTLDKGPPLPQSWLNSQCEGEEESLEASPCFPSAAEKHRGTLSSSCCKVMRSYELSVTKLHLWVPSQQNLWQRGQRVWQFDQVQPGWLHGPVFNMPISMCL